MKLAEILVQRDDKNRVTGLVVNDVALDTTVGVCAFHLLQATAASLAEYLHVGVESTVSDATYVVFDRSDAHLDRELDAVLETLVIGLRMLEKGYATELVVREATVRVEV